MSDFNLGEVQRLCKGSKSPRAVYNVLDWVSRLKEKQLINGIQYEEVKEVLMDKLKELSNA